MPRASAQSYDQLKRWCYDDATDDQTIQGCDAVINAGREEPTDIGWAFSNRGKAYYDGGQTDRAIQDYDQAIKLYPKSAETYARRGSAYFSKGEFDRAIEGFTAAIELNPKEASYYYSRGISKRAKGGDISGNDDIATANKIEPGIGK